MPTLAFGLNAAKSKAPASKSPQKRKNLFDDGSDGEGDVSNNNSKASAVGGFHDDSSRPRKSPRLDSPTKNGAPTRKYTNLASLHSAKKQDAAASQVDTTIYDYDDAYETFHAPKDAAKDVAGKLFGPKYMTSLLQSAEVRKRDQLRAKEKLLQKEREMEGDEFADKEEFVTGAYKAQQEAMRKLEEEERRQDAEEAERKKRGGGMQGFYKDLLRKDGERSALIAKAAEEAAQKPKNEPVVEETPEELEAAQKAAELNAKGARIVVNDEGEVVDKRQLLSAGLNVAAKPKTATNIAHTSSSGAKQEGYIRSSAARSARESQRERQSRMMEAQLEEIAAKQREQELEEERVREGKVKSTKSTTDVQSAKERYLARKREKEEEAKKAEDRDTYNTRSPHLNVATHLFILPKVDLHLISLINRSSGRVRNGTAYSTVNDHPVWQLKMLLIRRLWLLPAVLITLLLFFLFSRTHDSPSRSTYPANSNDGLLHWMKRPERYPVAVKQPPRGAANKLPAIQANFKKYPETAEAKTKREFRQAAVKEAFLHSWNGYKTLAWTKDELSPISGSWRSSFGGWGATLVDTMDTLWIMDLKEDFAQCVEAVRDIDFTTNTEEVLNVFETTIRYMGGLIAAYDLSGKKYKILLTKARELGEILYTAFDTPNRMPMTRWHWRKAALGNNDVEASTSTLLAELGSLSLEFTRLTQLTGDVKFYDATRRIADEMERMQNTSKIPGLWPTIIDASGLKADYNHFTLGGMADSTYEYLPKQHILLGARTSQYKHMYLKALEAAKKYLFFRPLVPDSRDILFSGNTGVMEDGTYAHEAQGQHLGCFVAGMVGMGARIFWNQDDLDIAQRLVDGCIWAYETMPTGLMPETFHMLPCHVGVDNSIGDECKWDAEKYYRAIAEIQGQDEASQTMSAVEKGKYWAKLREIAPGMTVMSDNRYILRPEAIESVFIMYRITGNPKLMDTAWKMFQDIDKWTRTELAHAALNDVRHVPPEKSDRMESFWLAETLKYFYLIFSEPSLISLDDYVLNTEAHPFKRPTGIPVWGGTMKGTIS